ncbi:hypothetical protein L615_004100000040 [Nocardioides sp. J9]|uniref:hypothetical protein n=1 Tax=unclassified Nocardioides TaxID=2615069 RepID=UPI0011A2A4C4|nr:MULTISPECIES: hypothetical protein [unclassified Nocardioides]TWG96747.1 hypothetical protein L615_004100000040 [Nocardioides sp. J9]
MNADLPPQPEPKVEPPEPAPGGPNSIEGVGGDGPRSTVGRDPNPMHNPATDEIPEAAVEEEDTDTAATRGDPEVPPESESPA